MVVRGAGPGQREDDAVQRASRHGAFDRRPRLGPLVEREVDAGPTDAAPERVVVLGRPLLGSVEVSARTASTVPTLASHRWAPSPDFVAHQRPGPVETALALNGVAVVEVREHELRRASRRT